MFTTKYCLQETSPGVDHLGTVSNSTNTSVTMLTEYIT